MLYVYRRTGFNLCNIMVLSDIRFAGSASSHYHRRERVHREGVEHENRRQCINQSSNNFFVCRKNFLRRHVGRVNVNVVVTLKDTKKHQRPNTRVADVPQQNFTETLILQY